MSVEQRLPSYLLDPNYFRLAYQLAAQRLNAAFTTKGGDLEAALDGGEDLLREIQQVRDSYDKRPGGLKPRELRLQRFLTRTVEPSTELVVAAALLRLGRRQEAELRASKVRCQADVKDEPLSYRALYNLACFDVTPPNMAKEKALLWLERALRKSHGRTRQEVVQWTRRDPSLKPLQDELRFREMLERYEIPGSIPGTIPRERRRRLRDFLCRPR